MKIKDRSRYMKMPTMMFDNYSSHVGNVNASASDSKVASIAAKIQYKHAYILGFLPLTFFIIFSFLFDTYSSITFYMRWFL